MSVATLDRPRKTASVKTEHIIVTPDMAAQWLESTNMRNRRLKESVIARYVADMRAKRWQYTGDAIRFDIDGVLLDGQHRLMASKRSGMSFETLVVYGLPSEAQDVIDSGATRTAGDALGLNGIANSAQMSVSIRQLLFYKSELITIRGASITTSAILDALSRHPGMTRSVACSGYKMPLKTPRGPLGFLHYAATTFAKKGASADAMIEVWRTGVPSYPGDPIHLFRERLMREANRWSMESTAWTLYHCWNRFSAGETATIVRQQVTPINIIGIDRNKL